MNKMKNMYDWVDIIFFSCYTLIMCSFYVLLMNKYKNDFILEKEE